MTHIPPRTRNSSSAPDAKKVLRCGIYTRKSTEDGLEQEFNSLDAQRESAEAYIKSQTHEGWVCLPNRYDDGGFTGGNMERPALQRLLNDIEAGQIDVVVVYKVDRLSRSLLDFARIMEAFDRKLISFVSITQQFNTTHSMGRLTLNILLSFAQFERELISERTRDKIAMTRKKGKWSGGLAILGYDINSPSRKLIIQPQEAEQVRRIYELYLEHKSLMPVVNQLQLMGWTNKRSVTSKGTVKGGKPFDKTSLHRPPRARRFTNKSLYFLREQNRDICFRRLPATTYVVFSKQRYMRECRFVFLNSVPSVTVCELFDSLSLHSC